MKLKPGPTNSYPPGGPTLPGDRGGVLAGFQVNIKMRRCILDFGTTVGWVTQSTDHALLQAEYMRTKIVSAFGELSVDPSTFPFIVEPHGHGMIKTDFRINAAVIVANPELFLVWGDKLKQCAEQMMKEGKCSPKERGH